MSIIMPDARLNTSPMKILIVDDIASDVHMLQRMLSSEIIRSILPPFTIRTVDTASKALNAYYSCRPDCMLLGHNLPDMTGLDLVQTLLASEGELTAAVVVMTGSTNANVAVQAMKLGVQNYLIKNQVAVEQLGWTIYSALEQMSLRRQLSDKQDELEHFAGRAAHDMISPLTNLSLFVEHLQDQLECNSISESTRDPACDPAHKSACESADELTVTFESVFSIVDYMASLIEGLNNYAKMGRNHAPVAQVDLQQIYEYILLIFDYELETSGAIIKADSLPTVYGDRVGLSQLLQNLIGNAIKYRAEETPIIEIRGMKMDGYWRISVSDNGIGIDPLYHHEIFEPCYRLHSRIEYPGSGLGLATCKRIVEQHGGQIGVESNLGQGTTIHVDLPMNESNRTLPISTLDDELVVPSHRHASPIWDTLAKPEGERSMVPYG